MELDEIKKAIRESIQSELGSYKMPKEQHYIDHLWINEQREWQIKIKNWSIKTIIGIIVSAVSYVIYIGLIAVGKIK